MSRKLIFVGDTIIGPQSYKCEGCGALYSGTIEKECVAVDHDEVAKLTKKEKTRT